MPVTRSTAKNNSQRKSLSPKTPTPASRPTQATQQTPSRPKPVAGASVNSEPKAVPESSPKPAVAPSPKVVTTPVTATAAPATPRTNKRKAAATPKQSVKKVKEAEEAKKEEAEPVSLFAKEFKALEISDDEKETLTAKKSTPKKESPVKKTTPAKEAPAKKVTPAKKETPANIVTPTKKVTPARKVTPMKMEAEQAEQAEEEEISDEEAAQAALDEAILQGIDSSEGEDSSDDEDMAGKEDVFRSMKNQIALNPKDEVALRKKTAAASKAPKVKPGVIYLGRIPHGFYEEEMKAYFEQFGTVSRLRLSRNKKTGRPKHYAFIEFESEEVAKIVAETMDNYLLYGHIMKCQVLPEDRVHATMFINANRKFKVIPWTKIARKQHNKPRTAENREQLVEKLLLKEGKKRKQLEELGIEYEFTGYLGDVKQKPTHIKF
ncbi:hypothetical protein BC936DRAFT_150068 [Jimgerdemannia flammicorona]|uniref:RRM domain-containing protein n=1 Tax=Jimgerdemannia flammicorona TaxID=994334 RepID=A0A433DN00_9FUNG|nr:hypothetical protein BC936DRAFT_150068 [Jimgerdemannia flammicorona]